MNRPVLECRIGGSSQVQLQHKAEQFGDRDEKERNQRGVRYPTDEWVCRSTKLRLVDRTLSFGDYIWFYRLYKL